MPRQVKPPVREAWANAVSADPDIVESVYVATGFPAPAGIPVVPIRGEFNFEMNRYDTGMIYLFQHGIADWDTGEDSYDTFDIVRDPGNGKFYQLIGTATPATGPAADTDNWYLCLRVPRPMTGETSQDEVAAWFNKKGYRITGKDHYGFNAGRILDFNEDWMDGGAANKTATAASALWFGRWNTAIDNGGGLAGLISLPGPYATDLSTHPWGPLVSVRAFGQSVNAVSIVETAKALIKMSAASLVLECGFSFNGASGPQTNTDFAVGLGDGTLAANRTTGATGAATAYGAWIEREASTANWQAKSKPNGGGGTGTDTGIAASRDAPHRYRCVVVGTSDSDDSTARVIHMIDGLVVANQTTSLNNQPLYPFVRAYANQGEVCDLFVGPMRIQVRLDLGDVLI